MSTLNHLFIFLALVIISNKAGGKELFITDKTMTHKNTKQFQYLKKLNELDKYYSDKKLGSFVKDGKTYFRLFAPSAVNVKLCTFEQPEDTAVNEIEMKKDSSGVWETSLEGEKYGLFYGFKVQHAYDTKPNNIICVDPYAKSVATLNTYYSPRRAMVVKENNYDWEGDESIQRDWRDLVIYELHIKDMTADSSSGAKFNGTYKGLVQKGITGGIDYIKSLGVNTVELLPSQEFANIEAPYEDSLNGRYNSWNPYEKNHWGYMTSNFFAPEAYYSTKDYKLGWDVWSGKSGDQIKEFKDMVKAFHKEGIGVMMDVVYNHLSEYETGNLKEIDKEYYFRLDENGNYISQSGTGNDLKTERPMVRRMIVESILYWMKEYHVDGFRFDLGKLIDWETIEEIIFEAKRINPKVVFVCEPWGGGYDPAGFSLRGWGAWNDQIRNGVKGENPVNGLGWIFGKWYGNNNPDRIKSYVNGTLVRDSLGLFQKKEHSVNYLESHDGYTLGDFIRIGLGKVKADEVIKDRNSLVKLSPEELKLNKLAALFLLTSQGITMISEGQEFARTKWIPINNKIKDEEKGRLDHNSYNKDNAANYINYNDAKENPELVNYYKGLILLRNTYDAFRSAKYEDITFFDVKDNQFALGYHIKYKNDEFIVLFNANMEKQEEFNLPDGNWKVLADKDQAGIEPFGNVEGKVVLESSTGLVIKK